MTREELLALVNKEVDTTKFKELSQKTIDEELDDVLEDFGDDEEANSKLVTKLANRLKRINGNLHKNISDEVKKSKEEAERKKRKRKRSVSARRLKRVTILTTNTPSCLRNSKLSKRLTQKETRRLQGRQPSSL